MPVWQYPYKIILIRICFHSGRRLGFLFPLFHHNSLMIPAMKFIRRLIRHIPEKNYQMIRYGLLCPPPRGSFSIQEHAVGGLSYKEK